MATDDRFQQQVPQQITAAEKLIQFYRPENLVLGLPSSQHSVASSFVAVTASATTALLSCTLLTFIVTL
jgi:uncharacterized membrane protein YraQ (UPF0718 family)